MDPITSIAACPVARVHDPRIEVDDDLHNKADGADFDTAVVKAGGGIAYFLRDGVAIEVRGMFSKAADDLYVDEDGNREDTNFTTSLGVRFYWD